MPRRREPIERVRSVTAHIAQRIRQRRYELRWSQKNLEDKYAEALGELGAAEPGNKRIAKLEAAGSRNAQISAAKAIEPWELEALAKALQVTNDWLLPPNVANNIAYYCDPFAHPQHVQGLRAWLMDMSRHANQMRGWAEFLPCSIETDEFMRAHHESLFLSDTVSKERAREVAKTYNAIGEQRRKAFLVETESGEIVRKNNYELVQLACRRDLEAIVYGKREYEAIDLDIRIGALRYLTKLIETPAMKVRLIVADDGDLPKELERELFAWDTVCAFDDNFAFWRDRRGNINWTRDSSCIREKLDLLDRFEKLASFREPAAVSALLNELRRSALAGAQAPKSELLPKLPLRRPLPGKEKGRPKRSA